MKHFYFFIFILATRFSFSQNFTDTKGELQISASGTATYSLPIAMPPSIKNVAPIINLTYSSGVRGGIAGQGWSINSISAISRIATRRDIDGYVDGVDFDDNDKLSLDGQRLLIKTGTYWANGSTYETEYKSNTRIELKIEGAVTYFVVTAPDGSRSWYGSKGSGSLQNSVSVNSWYIVRFEDTNENFIDYTYKNVRYNGSDQLYIDSIVFSGNTTAGIAAQDKIAFKYENAKRIERDFIKGGAVYATQILKSIEVYANNAIFRTYKLEHTTDDSGYQRVQNIKELNAQNEESNPVVFNYDVTPTTTTRTVKEYTNNLNFSTATLAGDFDGDGRLDFVANNKIFTNLFNNNSGNTPIQLVNGLVAYHSFTAKTLTNNKINQYHSIITPTAALNKIDFSYYQLNNGIFSNYFTKTIQINNKMVVGSFECQENDGGYNDYHAEHSSGNVGYDPATNLIEGDFNGDGISEVLFNIDTYSMNYSEYCSMTEFGDLVCDCVPYGMPVGNLKSYWLNLDQNASTTLGSKGFIDLNTNLLISRQKFVADFNGDGKSDVLVLNEDKTYKIVGLKELAVSPWMELEVLGIGTLDKYSKTKQMLFGDYNGDGKTDIMLPDTEGGEGHTLWHTYYSNPNPAGGEFFVKESQDIVEYRPDTGGDYKNHRHWSNYYSLDINHDGKSDLVRVRRVYLKPNWTINDHDTEWQVTGYTNNIGKVGAPDFLLTYDSGVFSSDSPDIPIPLVSNYRYNGANTDLVIVRGHHNNIEYYRFNKNFDSDNRLKTVSEADEKITQTIDYLPMEPSNGMLGYSTDFYSSAGIVNYPNVEIIRNSESFLVSKLTATINGISKYQDFRYRGYVSNFNYGTVGFTRTTRSSWYLSQGDEKIWTTQHNDVNLRGANTITWSSRTGTTVFDTTPSDLLSTKTNVFETYTKGGGDSVSSSTVQNVLTIIDPVTVGQTYKAGTSITASSAVAQDIAVNYQAPQIILKPGFTASAVNNSKFTATPAASQGGSNAPVANNSVYNVLLTKQTTIDHLSGVKNETVFSYDGVPNSSNYYGLETRTVSKKYSGTTLLENYYHQEIH